MRLSPLDVARRSMQQMHMAVGNAQEVRALGLERGIPTEKSSPDKPYHR
ncbi:hypothetical protein [Alicyclobacillus acidocaldarius]|uniref:Uncharacterized protein n=1 Tax=Alicyclobacillus acidocaldarius (strain Tc-4-1) TaxID=1048834 RepID=F8IF99_ALIAT|nr:hypothetical protein [Alicyclobacillus acidocaldarius]AEJ44064.1 hypothetical protein TC41_2158 [Alicyclobacillus acidocaldarius subsp. acidocaldarius Tc-4-1]